MNGKVVWGAIVVSLILLGTALTAWYFLSPKDWTEVSCEGLSVWVDKYADSTGAEFFPSQGRIMLWDHEIASGRSVQIRDFGRVCGELPVHVVVSGDGYSYGKLVTTGTPTFRIPHFSYANITVVNATEGWSSMSGGDYDLLVAHELTEVSVNFSANANQWVENPGVFVYTDASRTVEVENFTYNGTMHDNYEVIEMVLDTGIAYITVEGNVTTFSWEISGSSSYNQKTSIEITNITTKVGYCYQKTWLNATSNYSSPVLTMTLARNGTHSNTLITVMEYLTNITAMGLRCWLNDGVIRINGTDILEGTSRLYIVKTLWRDNTLPSITSYPDTTTSVGIVWSYNVVAVDPDPVDVPTYSLLVAPEGMEINESTGLCRWNPDFEGTYHVSIVAADELGNDTQTFTIVVDDSDWSRACSGAWAYALTPAGALLVILYISRWLLWDKVKDHFKSVKEDSKKV